MLAAWVLFPLVLAALCLGCGLLIEKLAGSRLPGALLLPVGLAVIIVAGGLTTAIGGAAQLTTPLVVALAVAGFVTGRPPRDLRPSGWALAAGVAVFTVFAAPILASGQATFAGYIKLDDTATWLALTDRIMSHGRDLSGLPPSTYEATLAFNLASGYPIGAFIPLGLGGRLTGVDVAWLFDPYIAYLGAMLALCLTVLAAPLVRRPWRGAALAFIAAQPALLYGYYLWGGVKEALAAALVALVGVLAAWTIEPPASVFRRLIPLAFAAAALLGSLSLGGGVWLAAPVALVALAGLAWRRLELGRLALGGAALIVMTAVLALPMLLSGTALPPTSLPLTSSDALGNLIHPLSVFQAVGIWPAGDFRVSPSHAVVADLLIALALAAALLGAWRAWRARAIGLLAVALGAVATAIAIDAVGSPWVGGKALAIGSPWLLALGGAGLLAGWRGARGAVAAALVFVLAGGVVWSNALAYHDANLAPRAQLAELEEIGHRIAGQGPTLMTEYQPYGVRHFLRDAAPEGASELRRRLDPLRSGRALPKGAYADLDRFALATVMQYRTLVLRRSPAESRPPAPYRLIWHGAYYDVWQRPQGAASSVIAHLPLGTTVDPAGVPRCDAVMRLAREAGRGGMLAAAPRAPVVTLPARSLTHPRSWALPAYGGALLPAGAGTMRGDVRLPRASRYTVWLAGSVRPQVDLRIDGTRVGSVRDQLENAGQYVKLGSARVASGVHSIAVHFEGPDLAPGSGGPAAPVGPLFLNSQEAAGARVVRIAPRDAQSLCGRRWDWIEALPASVAP